MARSVEVRVDGRGRVRAEFSGFPEGECGEEAESLERALGALGVRVRVRARRLKPPGVIRAELGLDSEAPARPEPAALRRPGGGRG
ncbi:MAG: DUF2997 domain-containing protein [Acetobacteraceae bacterium]|nr:DUF2997 domain-containing protein [Acetobacteraceae bacterium]